MPECNKNIWAPWRMEYIRSFAEEAPQHGCFLCAYRDNPENDQEHRVIWRAAHTFTLMNKFPYTNGHLLVALLSHKADLSHADDAELDELVRAIRDAQSLLRKAVNPDGFNVGFNIGRCAGAGLPDHLHAHVVPRWNGDTNFMPVLGEVRVIPDAIDAQYAQLREAANRMASDG